MTSSIRSIIFGPANLLAIFLFLGIMSSGFAKELTDRFQRQLMSGKGKGSADCVTLGASLAPAGKGKGGKGSSSEAPVSLKRQMNT
mmetsp:Transcript_9102/g.17369  ORF Transcript_9102/g.17369 Transcript_9102/m.17369 type:complete len:86 (-) Transcript_9102:306-563(-)